MTSLPTLRSSAAWSACANVISACARVASTIWLAHALTTSANGEVIFVLWIAASAILVCGAGLSGSLGRFISEGRSRDADGQSGAALATTVGRWLVGALLLGAVVLGALLVALPGRAPGPWWLPSALVLVLGLEGLGTAGLSGRLQFARQAQLARIPV